MKEETVMEEERIQKKMELGSKMGRKARHSFQGVYPQHTEPAELGLEAQQQCSRKLSGSLSLPVHSHIHPILL